MAAMDKRYLRIKERLLDRALDLWGIEDERQLDPVVDLLLEAVAFESFLRGVKRSVTSRQS